MFGIYVSYKVTVQFGESDAVGFRVGGHHHDHLRHKETSRRKKVAPLLSCSLLFLRRFLNFSFETRVAICRVKQISKHGFKLISQYRTSITTSVKVFSVRVDE